MSRTTISKHYTRLAAQWPKDILRPQVQFQNLLKARISSPPAADVERDALLTKALGSPPTPRAQELSEVNALYLLLENRFSKTSPLPDAMMRPTSDPEYYDKLRTQLDETPGRSWFSNLARRLGGMIRLQ